MKLHNTRLKVLQKELLQELPTLVNSMAVSVATAITTTTDLVRKSVAVESHVGGTTIRVWGCGKKASGMIHPSIGNLLRL
ncbi:unnamed protein product [Thlaspi arvense]|uniref:Uncharacterized protein n=1 Tax=Thlaspi arvense TaxID=13288 RepID=A0AAU9S7X5_THLAR|nr:unnamed protein product [Thlaspi arvense]